MGLGTTHSATPQ